ncbi:hypothetical protein CDL15_Pgr004765 [Punica granatum]|uniref:Myb/SANT-like domain-containing protein n=1 Tax=Punica granatum TaxID=22663 RepID=A0A218W6W6_PUNGR|nr:hypothetical protein CDL15_Pgr004765 [Punica granatum]
MKGSFASVNSQVSKSGKRKWTMADDAVLISCMISLRNMGTHNTDIGFKSGYLQELEKMLLEKLPNCGIKARPHIESRLKTLKKEWAIVHDMMLNTSGFGWDSQQKMMFAIFLSGVMRPRSRFEIVKKLLVVSYLERFDRDRSGKFNPLGLKDASASSVRQHNIRFFVS